MDKILLALAEFRTEMKNFFSSASTISADLVKDLKAQLATATTAIAAHEGTIKELRAAAGTATTTLAAKETEITTLKASVETEKKRANSVIAGQGLPADAVPKATAGELPGTQPESAWNKYHRLLATDGRTAGRFYAENAEKIFASRPAA